MLLYQIYNIDNALQYTELKLRIIPVGGWLADVAHRSVVCRYKFYLHSVTELWIQAKELLFDNAYLSKVVDDMKTWFTRMEVGYIIYHHSLFTANSLEHPPVTSQYFQCLAPQT